VWQFDHSVPLAVVGAFDAPFDCRFPLTSFTLNRVNPGGTVGSGQALVSQFLDTVTGNTYWLQGSSTASTAAGQQITLNDTAPTTDRWNLAAVEVTPASSPPPDTIPPTVSITNPASGQTVSGTVPVAATASDDTAVASVQFFLDGKALGSPVPAAPYAVQWDTITASNGSHTLSAQATDASGNVGTSQSVSVTVQNPAPPMTRFVMQANVRVHGRGTVTTPSFHTAAAGETLLAFVGSDGPAQSAGQTVTVSGAGLTWTLVKRANGHFGDAEVWQATASSVLSSATVTSTPAHSGVRPVPDGHRDGRHCRCRGVGVGVGGLRCSDAEPDHHKAHVADIRGGQ
jgi:Bacterial Ig domain